MASSKSADSDRPHAAELAYLTIAATYPENESGTSLKRPELFRLLSDCKPGDVLLIEQVDRLSRLTAQDWEKLKREIKNREVKVIALDLPTSHAMVRNEDQFTGRLHAATEGRWSATGGMDARGFPCLLPNARWWPQWLELRWTTSTRAGGRRRFGFE